MALGTVWMLKWGLSGCSSSGAREPPGRSHWQSCPGFSGRMCRCRCLKEVIQNHVSVNRSAPQFLHGHEC